jgi:hypothetical protein
MHYSYGHGGSASVCNHAQVCSMRSWVAGSGATVEPSGSQEKKRALMSDFTVGSDQQHHQLECALKRMSVWWRVVRGGGGWCMHACTLYAYESALQVQARASRIRSARALCV